MKSFTDFRTDVRRVVVTKKNYIYFGMVLAIISLVLLLAAHSFLLSAVGCPIISGLLAFCVIKKPNYYDILGITLGWGMIFILFLFG